MRKTLLALSAGAAVAMATPAAAQDRWVYPDNRYVGPVVAGAVVGTTVGLGLYHGWWSGSTVAALPNTAAGSAAVGGLAGIGTVALIHAATTPCQGFHAAFSGLFTSPAGCVNGRWVGERAVMRRR